MTYERIIVGLFAFFALSALVLTPVTTGMYSAEDGKPLKVRDKVYRFFDINNIQFLQSENMYCQQAIDDILNKLLDYAPHVTRYVHYDDREGFARYIYGADYLTGTIDLAKGSAFVNASGELPAKLHLKTEEIIFGKYENRLQYINIDLNLTGEIGEELFIVSAGSLKVDDVNCQFK